MFGIEEGMPEDQAQCAWTEVSRLKKSEFALDYAINNTDWTAPGYILDGLRWLASVGNHYPDDEMDHISSAQIPEDPVTHSG